MKRSEKIKVAAESERQAKELDLRDPAKREEARREWAVVRKSARDAFLAEGSWQNILDSYKERDGFYTPGERDQMCKAYSEELIMNALR